MVAILSFVFILFSNINSISATTYACNQSSSCGCSGLSTIITSKIVGGEAASNYAWGWMASFQLAGAHQCGASLLTSEYAVTAAHCVEDLSLDMSSLSIVVGTNYLNVSSPTMQRRSIISMTKYPTYDNTHYVNDIGILQFAPLDVSLGSEISFICLPEQNQDPFQMNTSLVAIGWGVTSENSNTVSNYLQQVTVQVLSASEGCTAAADLTNSTSQFCAGVIGGGKDTCQGDSGGPLMAFVNNVWVLAGVTSSGEGCAQPGYPGIYTRVSAFVSFIESIVNSSVTEPTIPISATTTTVQQNHTKLSSTGNLINISISMIWFSILVFSLFSF